MGETKMDEGCPSVQLNISNSVIRNRRDRDNNEGGLMVRVSDHHRLITTFIKSHISR